MPTAQPLLHLDQVEAAYQGAIVALHAVSLSVLPGEIHALLGANGAGKSTALKAISNLLPAQRGQVRAGQIRFEGRDVRATAPSELVRQGLVPVLEGRHCFPSLSVEENLVTGALGRGARSAEIAQGLERVYALFPRLKARRHSPSGLTSGGEQQMTAIGRALMSRPRLLVLDEPSMGLAPRVVQEIFQQLRRLNREEGLSILVAEQNSTVALQYADRATVLEAGHTVLTEAAASLRQREDVQHVYFGRGVATPAAADADFSTHPPKGRPMSTPTTRVRVNSPEPFAPRPRPASPAHVIRSDAQALEIARRLSAEFAVEASLRDSEGYLPLAELDAYSQSGLWGITVPKAYGGAGVSYATLAEVIRILAQGDSSIAQITQNHLALVAHIALDASEEQKHELFGLVLQGIRFGNAFSEKGSKNVAAFETRLRLEGDEAVVNGQKFYTTGALLAHLVPIVAVDEEGKGWLAFAERDAPGLTVVNDWSSFGQRTTASGSIRIENVRVPRSRLVPVAAFERPTAAGAISQIIQSAIDAGIAAAAIAETIAFVRTRSRPWIDSGKESAGEDPFTISAIGELVLRLHASEALLERAGRAIDTALANPSEDTATQATLATAESKVLTTEVAIAATNKLFELSGTRSTLLEHNLDRHWRNARTHTLHDPVRWKNFHIGNYHLNDVAPPRHPWN